MRAPSIPPSKGKEMPRKPAVIPQYKLKVSIPEDLMGRLTLELWSDLEGRVPLGAYSATFEALLRRHFDESRLDLATLLPDLPPGVHFIYGAPGVLALLRQPAKESA